MRWAYAPSGVRPSFTLQAMWNDYSEFVCKAAAILDWHHSTQTVQQNWYHCTRRWVEFDSQVGVTRRVWNSSIKILVSTPNGNCVPMLAIQCNSVKAMPQSKAALQILQTDSGLLQLQNISKTTEKFLFGGMNCQTARPSGTND